MLDIIVSFIPISILFDEISLSQLRFFTKVKIFKYVNDKIIEERRYHEINKNFTIFNDYDSYYDSIKCIDKIDKKIKELKSIYE